MNGTIFISLGLVTSLLGAFGNGRDISSRDRSPWTNLTPSGNLTGVVGGQLQSTPFQSVLGQAMQLLKTQPTLTTPLYAPTIIPIPASTGRNFASAYAQTLTTPASSVKGYDVRLYLVPKALPLNSSRLLHGYPASWVAGFNGVTYPTRAQAAANVNNTAGIKPMRMTGASFNLGHGIIGHEFFVTPRQNNSHLENTAIIWQQNKWTVGIYHVGSRIPDTDMAREIVAYLATHRFPVPDTRGAITISDSGPKYTYAHIAWNHGNDLYYEYHYLNPLDALKMVASTQRYP